MGKAQFLLKEAGAVPQFSIKQDHVLNIIFSQLKLLLRPSARTHLHADLILCSEIPKYTKKRLRFGLLVTELSQCSGRGTVTLALEFGRNVTLPLLAWKFIISLIAPDYVLLIVEYH